MKPGLRIIVFALIILGCQKEITQPTVVPLSPTISTTAVSSVTSSMATSGGNITDDGGAPVTARGICWGTTPTPVVAGNHTSDGQGIGVFGSNITGLTITTTYYVRAYATNSEGTVYGNEISFTTTNTATALPTVSTAAIASITMTTASGGGEVLADGGATVTARGICWGTTIDPVVTGSHTTDGAGTGIFTSAITGLTAGSVYHVRAYATNSVGTSYGADSVFTAAAATAIPVVTTAGILNITSTSANGGGTVVNDGGASVTVRGVCWSTTADPTTASSKTTDGAGTGAFTSVISGLTAGTQYHVRAYATNSVGTGYGADSVFTANAPADIFMAGYENTSSTTTVAKYWRNGTSVLLPSSDPYAYAKDIFVSGTDVYVVGNTFFSNGVNFGWSAVIWKNGVRTTLAQTSNGSGYADATSVFVSGNDVYVAGFVRNTSGTGAVVKLWKNGVATDLTSGATLAKGFSVFVAGADVYVAGSEFNVAGSNIAKYWKNGVATVLSSVDNNGEAEAIFVSGTDVYVGGRESAGGLNGFAKLWKNGVATSLTPGPNDGYAHDIYVAGGNVYVAGQDYLTTDVNSSVAKSWKNNVDTILPGPTPAYGTAIGVKGSDVYTAGYEWNGSLYVAKLWKNNVSISISNGMNSTVVTGMFVQ